MDNGEHLGRKGIRVSPGPWLPPGLVIFLVSILVVACSSKGCGDTEFETPTVQIYNRTVDVVRFGQAWAPACNWKNDFDLAQWPRARPPQLSPPPYAISLPADLGVPPDYQGNVSIIVSKTGVEIVHGDIDESRLPLCTGEPPSPPLVTPIPSGA